MCFQSPCSASRRKTRRQNVPECGGGEGEGEDSIPALLMVPAAGLTQVISGHHKMRHDINPIDNEDGGK